VFVSPGDIEMKSVPATITSIVRRMRGPSQAHLVHGDDGHCYVAKFAGNPQGTRTMVNEWIAYELLTRVLGVSTPLLRILSLPPSLLNEDLCFRVGTRLIPPEGVVHLGSQCPVDPEETAIWDFLPSKFFVRVLNLSEFAAMLVFDTWVCRTAPRQAIFVTQRSAFGEQTFKAHFIGHATSFGGRHWKLGENAIHGAYFQAGIYSLLDMSVLVEKTVCRLEAITEAALFATLDGVPPAWFLPGDGEDMRTLLGELRERQPKMRSILAHHIQAPDKCVSGR
jgi:hypothetical protein